MTTLPLERCARLQIAVVGCGPVGALHAQAIVDSPAAELIGICEVDAARRDKARQRFDVPAYHTIDDLLADLRPNAVTVATPDHLHLQPVCAAIEADCHVFCEKPLATSVSDAEQMLAAATRRGVFLAVDYNRRFADGYRSAHEMLRERQIGELEYFLFRVTDRTPPPKVAREPYVIFGTLLTHHLDLARWYGGELWRMHAHADEIGHGLLRRVTLSLEMKSGACGTIVAAYRDHQSRTAEWLTLHGTKGTIIVEDASRCVTLSGNEPECCISTEPSVAGENAITDSIMAHVRAFVENVAVGRQSPVTGQDGLASLQLAATAVESITSGKSVDVRT